MYKISHNMNKNITIPKVIHNWYVLAQQSQKHNDIIIPNVMQNWYVLAQQQRFPFYEGLEQKEPPVPPELINAPKTIEMLNETIDDCKNYFEIAKALHDNGFSWEQLNLNGNQIITVDIGNEVYVISDLNYPEAKNGREWINEMWDHDISKYIPPKPENSFWDDVGERFFVYHATNSENVDNVLKHGLEPRYETRGISNRSTGAAVFTSDNPDDIASYGDYVFEINVSQMKKDGYMPEVSGETPAEEVQNKSSLAWKIGLRDYEPSEDYTSEGIYDTTIIFYGVIPPKYLRLM